MFYALDLVNDAMHGIISDSLINILKPHLCDKCGEKFPDIVLLKSHLVKHVPDDITPVNLIPKNMKVPDLKKELIKHKLSTSGSKAALCARLKAK